MRAVLSTLSLALVLAGCATVPLEDRADRRAGEQVLALPPMSLFGPSQGAALTRSRSKMAADFLDLSFLMESGRELPVLTRYEAPIRVAVTGGRVPPTLDRDLGLLLGRMQREAGLDIARVAEASEANLIVETLPRARLQRIVPQAACFVVPNATSWQDYLSKRRSREVDWTELKVRTRAAVFLPDDVSPQEVRDCLHEEIAQAVGPLNDLYRLESSIFNDDNFHMVLTSFDMLILRLTYAPELRSGMSRAQVAAVLPGLLARYAPGQPEGSPVEVETVAPRAWIRAVETALGPGAGQSRRLEAARTTVRQAEQNGLQGTRLAFSYYVLGRLSLGSNPELALASFLTAGRIYSEVPGTQIHRAQVSAQLAAFALSAGDGTAALGLVNGALPAATDAQNAGLMATLLMMKAEALTLSGRPAEAQAVRLDSLGWARYGFGSDREVEERLREIAAVTPEQRRS